MENKERAVLRLRKKPTEIEKNKKDSKFNIENSINYEDEKQYYDNYFEENDYNYFEEEDDSYFEEEEKEEHNYLKDEGESIDDDKNKKFTITSKNRKRLIVTNFADQIIKNNKIIYMNDSLYLYNKELGYYQKLSIHEWEVFINKSIPQVSRKFLVTHDITSIYKFIKISSAIQLESEEFNNERYINCINGVLDLKSFKKLDHSEELKFFNCLNVKLKSCKPQKFYKSNFYKFIKNVTGGDEELIKLIQEITGYSLSNYNNAKKFFVFYGVSNSGKSVYLDLLEYMIREENVSHIPLQKLEEEKYSAELFGKLLNTYSELPDDKINDLGQIKALVSKSDKITARKLYGDPFSFKNKATLIFATNNLPEIKTKLYQDTTAFFNRLIIVPFLHSVPEDEQDKFLINKLIKEKNYVFAWAMEGLKRYIENGFCFSKCNVSSQYLNSYLNEQNLVDTFISEKIIYDNNKYEFWESIKNKFQDFAKENGKSIVNYKEFNYLKNRIENKLQVEYKKIHRDNKNKWGFKGIYIV